MMHKEAYGFAGVDETILADVSDQSLTEGPLQPKTALQDLVAQQNSLFKSDNEAPGFSGVVERNIDSSGFSNDNNVNAVDSTIALTLQSRLDQHSLDSGVVHGETELTGQAMNNPVSNVDVSGMMPQNSPLSSSSEDGKIGLGNQGSDVTVITDLAPPSASEEQESKLPENMGRKSGRKTFNIRSRPVATGTTGKIQTAKLPSYRAAQKQSLEKKSSPVSSHVASKHVASREHLELNGGSTESTDASKVVYSIDRSLPSDSRHVSQNSMQFKSISSIPESTSNTDLAASETGDVLETSNGNLQASSGITDPSNSYIYDNLDAPIADGIATADKSLEIDLVSESVEDRQVKSSNRDISCRKFLKVSAKRKSGSFSKIPSGSSKTALGGKESLESMITPTLGNQVQEDEPTNETKEVRNYHTTICLTAVCITETYKCRIGNACLFFQCSPSK